jgi:hypothetical protein
LRAWTEFHNPAANTCVEVRKRADKPNNSMPLVRWASLHSANRLQQRLNSRRN